MNPPPHDVPIVCATAAVEETRRLAAALAGLLVDGDLLVLVGDLGAGKTAFTQGLAAALGVDGPVTSPTFTLANRYEGRLVINHLDAYRIEAVTEIRDLAIPELLDDGVTVIEWGDVILVALPDERLEVAITFGDGDDDRRFELTAVGRRWCAAVDDLARTVDAWAST